MFTIHFQIVCTSSSWVSVFEVEVQGLMLCSCCFCRTEYSDGPREVVQYASLCIDPRSMEPGQVNQNLEKTTLKG